MTKCYKCGGSEIARGKIRRSSYEYFSDIVFGPDNLRFLALTLERGTKLAETSYACLDSGSVWSETNPIALRDFIQTHCKAPNDRKLD
jgi:hypothetical protein